jgi:hypothetical protein
MIGKNVLKIRRSSVSTPFIPFLCLFHIHSMNCHHLQLNVRVGRLQTLVRWALEKKFKKSEAKKEENNSFSHVLSLLIDQKSLSQQRDEDIKYLKKCEEDVEVLWSCLGGEEVESQTIIVNYVKAKKLN